MPSDSAPQYRRYRAPRDNNSVVSAPPFEEVRPEVSAAIQDVQFGDWRLGDLRESARRELIAAAVRYSAEYLSVDTPSDPNAPLILTGHQAELFHPGVWFKNFALSRLAERHQGIGIHLVIDSDTVHGNGILVPTGSVQQPTAVRVPMDASAAPLPVEEEQIADEQLFASFSTRVQDTIQPLIDNPLISTWWPQVVAATKRTSGNGHMAIAQARHELEQTWGAKSLELPMSQACRLSAFAPFVATLLIDAPRAWQAYNEALAAYRQAHRLRTDAQPMPDLAQDDWLEMPFWIWTADNPQRRSLFVRTAGGELQLTDRSGWTATISATHSQAAEQLAQLESTGVKLRTRALTTTLYARLVLGDLFLHGIGGAKYDEVTDDWARRLWGIAPPPYMALSATLHLPIEHEPLDQDALHQVRQNLRDWQWHPERWLDESSSSVARVAETLKREWVEQDKTPDNAAQRHQGIAEANATLRHETDTVRQLLETGMKEVQLKSYANQILESREYSFCLFPERDLRQRMWQLVDK